MLLLRDERQKFCSISVYFQKVIRIPCLCEVREGFSHYVDNFQIVRIRFEDFKVTKLVLHIISVRNYNTIIRRKIAFGFCKFAINSPKLFETKVKFFARNISICRYF